MDDLVQWLRAVLDGEAEEARSAAEELGGDWYYDDGFVLARREDDMVVTGSQDFLETERGRHIAAHDPARVLREVEAKRRLLDDVLSDGHHRNEEDHWYSCAALTDEYGEPLCFDESRAPGPCDCGRDARVTRRLSLLTLPYADRPGYRKDWRP